MCDKLGKQFPYNGWRPGGVMETQREEELCLRGEEESGVEMCFPVTQLLYTQENFTTIQRLGLIRLWNCIELQVYSAILGIAPALHILSLFFFSGHLIL